jgi:D-alanyl-D-alanine carboxypeptidase (penicillin-binding protein 5/6)
MSFRRFAFFPLLVIWLGAVASLPAAAKKPAPAPTGTYKGAIVMDAASGNVLIEENADQISPPASMTKLMTFAVLDDQIHAGVLTLQSSVTVTAADAKMGGTQVWLADKEVFSVEELTYAMMIQSANDAAHALARTAAGNVEAFVALMNAKARALGMTHTTFVTPHGLPPVGRKIADGDLTTPRDFALLCRYLLTKTDVLKYTSVKERVFRANSPTHAINMINHDHLLHVDGVDGLKTGYTEAAGYCLSSTAQRNGQRVIVVIMGSFGPNGQIDLGKFRDKKAAELIERGFTALPANGAKFTGPAAPTTNTPVVPTAAQAGSPIVPASPPPATDSLPMVIFTPPGQKK